MTFVYKSMPKSIKNTILDTALMNNIKKQT